LTTFFAMAYIIFVNPSILVKTGMPWGGVFLATIFASIVGTMIMALVANVPYAVAPGMGLNTLFLNLCLYSGFVWQEALAMVFICGIINILITVTKLRKYIIKSIPLSLQHAIGGGIGIFIAYIGLKNANLVAFFDGGAAQGIATFNSPGVILTVIGLMLTVVLMVLKVKGAIFIGIIVTTLIGIPMGVVDPSSASISFDSIGTSFQELGSIFGKAFGNPGIGSLFSDASKIPFVIMTIFSLSLADTFDTIGTFIGTGRRTGIFDAADELVLESSPGFKSKMDKALFADSIASSIGAVLGTSNTTTYVESSAGIAVGGRTGLTSVVVSVCMLLCIILSPVAGLVPAEATAPALIIVGVLMAASFAEIKWEDFEEALPAFFTAVFMGFFYSITEGIAVGFIFFTLIKLVKGKFKELHPILLCATVLFLLNYILQAIG
jgi:AGZA family xanthine/uracil permease-like MFS transporter